MPSTQPKQIESSLSAPLPADAETYCLYYIQGSNHQVKQKNFVGTGGLGVAITRGKRHCETMSYRFIRVQPFFSNLEADEKRNSES